MNAENDQYWQELAKEDEREMAATRQYYADLKEHNNAWVARWPNYCTKCGGWGYFFYPGKFSGPPENCYPDDQEPCYHLPEGTTDVGHRTDTPILNWTGRANIAVTNTTTGYERTDP